MEIFPDLLQSVQRDEGKAVTLTSALKQVPSGHKAHCQFDAEPD